MRRCSCTGPGTWRRTWASPAGSAPSGLTFDRASDRVIIGAATGLFACDPETLEVEQSLLGGD